MKRISFEKLILELPIDKIDLSDKNARQSNVESGLEELQTSIVEMNLIQPVVVIAKGDRYKLIVGQRRYLASKALGKNTLPALVIRPLDSTSETIVSFGENIHRRKLPYEDAIRVCDEMYNEYTSSKSKSERINKIVKALGLSPESVRKYLAYKLIPDEVRKLVSNGKLSREIAYRITSAYFPSTQRIIRLAKSSTRLTKSETRRAVEFGIKKPNAPFDEIMEHAKNPQPTVEIRIQVEPNTAKLLEDFAKRRNSTVSDIVLEAINKIIEDET